MILEATQNWLAAVDELDTRIKSTQVMVEAHMERIEASLALQVPIQAEDAGKKLVGLITHRDRAFHLVGSKPPPLTASCPTCVTWYQGQVGQIVVLGPPVSHPMK